ncbi:hypothetical protein MBRA_02488 [Methylobacterium brachiatum]|nr:hypothetical protein MBRA_02488 [Methylobacterium brachiatum]
MTYQKLLTPEQIQRLRAYGTAAPGIFPTADDHAPPPPAPALPARRRQTYDAAALAEIRDGIAELGRGIASLTATHTARQARATADAAHNAILVQGRAVIDRTRTGLIAMMNTRAAEVHSRKVTGSPAARSVLPPGFTADASGAVTPAAINARAAEVWAKRA